MTELPPDLTPLVLDGHVLDVLRSLPEGSVQCVVTSPPYWGLRAYGTEPQIWGGDLSHVHEWVATPPRRSRSAADATSTVELASVGGRNYEAQGGESCSCGAWRGELGLEATPELFVSHLADVFDEVRRVLRDDGTLWLNLGDSYAASPRGSFDRPGPAEIGREIEGRRSTEGFDKRAPGLKPKDLVGIPWRVAFAEKHAAGVRAVIWNEGGLRLVMEDRGIEVGYQPEIYPETEMFFSREHKRERKGFGDPGNRIWEGEYEPVLFAKKDLVKFLQKYSGGDKALLDSVKTLRVTQKKESTEEMLDLETDDVRRIEEETEVTNIPRHFTMQMRVTEGIDAVFEFEAALYKPEPDDYMSRAEAKTKRIAVRVVNARAVLKDMMQTVLARLPSGIPAYYGRFAFADAPKER